MTAATPELAIERATQIAKRTRITGEDPDDLVQEAHLVVAQLLPRQTSLEYICGAVRNRMREILRRKQMERKYVDFIDGADFDRTYYTVHPDGTVEDKVADLCSVLTPAEKTAFIAMLDLHDQLGHRVGVVRLGRELGKGHNTAWRLMRAIAEKAIQRGLSP